VPLVDRLGGLIALSRAGPCAVVAIGALALVARPLGGLWPEGRLPPRAAWAPALAAIVVLVALLHPFFYYPDVDTHSDFVNALRADPALLRDPTPFQERTGAWTRELAGRRVLFPYSPAFHLLAAPLAPWLGASAAVKTLAVVAVGASGLLVHALGRWLGLSPPAAVLAQVMWVALPVTSSRLTLALFPALLGQALELLLLATLAWTGPGRASLGASTRCAAAAALAFAAYTGALLTLPALLAVFAAWEAAAGERRRAAHVALASAAALLAVVPVMYGRDLPRIAAALAAVRAAATTDAAGAVGGSDPAGGLLVSSLLDAIGRLGIFYDLVFPALAVGGLAAVRHAAPHARRVVLSALFAATALCWLRYLVPAVFRDVKEVELLAAPVALLAAAALGRLWTRGRLARAAGSACALGAIAWSVSRGAQAYLERFLAAGR
jgi:hypothetical protein